MTYEECLKELEEINIKEDFVKEFEALVDPSFLLKLKEMETISSTANLVRHLLRKFKEDSKEWIKWYEVFRLLITPEFARSKHFKKETQLSIFDLGA